MKTLYNFTLSTIFAICLVFVFSSNSAVAQKSEAGSFIKAVVAITGSAYDAVTKKPISVSFNITDKDGKRVNTTKSNAAEDGYYYIPSLKPGHKYFINISQPDYFKETIEIEIPNTDKYQEISRDFLVKPMKKDVKLSLRVSPFELNKTKLRFGSEDFLEEYVSSMSNNPNVKFEIQCFPDNDNDPLANKKLTEERCKSLINYFTSNGISIDRMTISGSDKTDPSNPPPVTKRAKGKRYTGSTYIVVKSL